MNAENKQKHMGKSAGLWWGLGVLLAAALGLIAWGTVTLLTAPSAGQREIRYDYRTAAVGDSADADEIHPQQWRLRQFLTEQDDADTLLTGGLKSGSTAAMRLSASCKAERWRSKRRITRIMCGTFCYRATAGIKVSGSSTAV